VKSRASLAQATGSRLGETINRRPCETHESSLKWATTRLSENTPRLGYTCSNVPQAPTRPRLGKPLSPERDGVSLKTRALRLSESSSASASSYPFLQVSLRRDWVAWGRMSGLVTFLPATVIQSYPKQQYTSIHTFYNSTTTIQSWKQWQMSKNHI